MPANSEPITKRACFRPVAAFASDTPHGLRKVPIGGFTLTLFARAVQAAFAPDGRLARPTAGLAASKAQAEMAQAVAEAIERPGGVLAIEAGTGVGKTWAYLTPLLMGGRRAWLSTGTQALQDQLFHRDIPALSQALGLPVRAALLKGRSNYVCLQRVDMACSGAMPTMATEPAWTSVMAKIRHWAAGSATGDLAELPGLDERSPLRPWISSTRDNCLRDACPRLGECHVFRARRKAQQADWVVINHHLYIAGQFGPEQDLAGLLPAADVVVFDEAHRLIDLGEALLGLSLGSDDLRELARDMQTLGGLWAKGLKPWAHQALLLVQAATGVSRLAAGRASVEGLTTWEGLAPKGVSLAAWYSARWSVLQALQGAVVALQSVAEAAAPLQSLAHRAQRLCETWQSLAHDGLVSDDQPATDLVRWIEWREEGRWQVRRSAPDFGETFQRAMAEPSGPQSWVFTSATLGTDADLTWFTNGLGLRGKPGLRTHVIHSPFDHARLASLYVPEQLPEPATEGHPEALAVLVAEWAALLGGRTLVLTTSLRASARIGAALRERLVQGNGGNGGLQVLSQGSMSKRALLTRFRSAGTSGPGAVLVASASFWEGVDLAGDLLQLLVIDKLPFPSPGDPLTQVRERRARQKGQDVFQVCYADKAALALKQGAGRLIRSASDRGVLVIADRRLVTQGYGTDLLSALPALPRLMDAAQMHQALMRLAAPPSVPA